MDCARVGVVFKQQPIILPRHNRGGIENCPPHLKSSRPSRGIRAYYEKPSAGFHKQLRQGIPGGTVRFSAFPCFLPLEFLVGTPLHIRKMNLDKITILPQKGKSRLSCSYDCPMSLCSPERLGAVRQLLGPRAGADKESLPFALVTISMRFESRNSQFLG